MEIFTTPLPALASEIPEISQVLNKKSVEKILLWFIVNCAPEQAETRQWCYRCLTNLAKMPESREVLMRNELASAVLKALTNDRGYDGAMQEHLKFLTAFASKEYQAAKYFYDTGVVNELVSILRNCNAAGDSKDGYLDDSAIAVNLVAFFTAIAVYEELMMEVGVVGEVFSVREFLVVLPFGDRRGIARTF